MLDYLSYPMLSSTVNTVLFIGLATTVGSSVILPETASVLAKSITCQATIPLNQGNSLTYRLTGTLTDPTPQPTPLNPVGTILTMTVQHRDRNGRLQTLLNASTVESYEQIAPDADYSKLPFTGVFRGQPNNGFRLYAVRASRYGLYASLRPIDSQPQQMQIIHYLSSGKFIRSIAGRCYS